MLMGDHEQAMFAEALTEDLPPLQAARAAEQAAQGVEWTAALEVTALKGQVRALEGEIEQLRRAERLALTLEDGRAWRTQRQTLEHQRHQLGAHQTAVTEARLAANADRVQAMAAYDTLAKLATTHSRVLRAAQHREADARRDTGQGLDAQDRRIQAFTDLCGLVGEAEAQRVQRDPQYRPDWIRD
jgi:hypothetical protein